jgi:hypothetical protein
MTANSFIFAVAVVVAGRRTLLYAFLMDAWEAKKAMLVRFNLMTDLRLEKS